MKTQELVAHLPLVREECMHESEAPNQTQTSGPRVDSGCHHLLSAAAAYKT